MVEKVNRQEKNRLYVAKKRASENQCSTICRQEQNRMHMAKKRALESWSDRQEHDQVRTARKRALESPIDTICRQEQNRARIVCRSTIGGPHSAHFSKWTVTSLPHSIQIRQPKVTQICTTVHFSITSITFYHLSDFPIHFNCTSFPPSLLIWNLSSKHF